MVRTEFHDNLDSLLTELVKEGGFMIITSPPRHGKSERISRKLPAWLFARDPSCEIIGASYNAELAKRMSKDVRRNLGLPRYQELYPETRITRGDSGIMHWGLTAGGSYRSAGMDTGVNGMGCNWLLIDDPLKGRESADSLNIRDKIWDEYTASFRLRLEPDRWGKYGVIVTLTRWHHDDLAGRLQRLSDRDPDADQFVTYRFPALAEADAEDRYPGDTREDKEPLWPEKYGKDKLKGLRALSERNWASLFQGRPGVDGGNIFKPEKFKLWYEPCHVTYAPAPHIVVNADQEDIPLGQISYPTKRIVATVLSVDCAFKKTAGSDYVAIGVWSRTRNNEHFLRYLVEERLSANETYERIKDLAIEYKVGKILVEDAANGSAVEEALISQFGAGKVEMRPTKGGKVARANAVAYMAEKCYLPHPLQAPWVLRFLQIHADFPAVVNDDIVDQTTHYLAWIIENSAGSASDRLRILSQGV